ncbi:MAG: BamA/TamA family outer membrane protein [Chloroherpetonaceae bacterium]|nr:BamA/TamA family outer membrane protein [Chloroherpetonaceae bacterium]
MSLKDLILSYHFIKSRCETHEFCLRILILSFFLYSQSFAASQAPDSTARSFQADSISLPLKFPLRISNIRYEGLRQFRESALTRVFESEKFDSRDAFRLTINSAEALARQEGFLEFLIERADFTYNSDSTKAEMLLSISEGPLYLLQRVHFIDSSLSPQNQPLPREINRILEEIENSPFQNEALEDAANRIITSMETSGYPFAKVSVSSIDPEGKDPEKPDILPVSLSFTLFRGAFVTVGDILVNGLQTTKPDIVLRELPFRTGDVFLEKNLPESNSKLLRLGLFDKVIAEEPLFIPNQAQEKQHSLTDSLKAIIRFTLEEGNPNTFDGILGYQPALGPNDEGFFTGQINFSLRNLFGTARRLEVRWTKPNAPTQDVRLFYQEPWVLNLPLTLSLELLQLKQDSSFSQLNYGVTGIFRFNTNFWITGNFSRELVTPIIESLTPSQTIFQSTITLSGLGVLYDSRDYPLNPQSGWLFKNEYRIGTKTIAGSDSLLSLFGLRKSVLQQRFSLDLEFYQRLFFRQVLFLRLKGSAILSDEIQFSDLMRIGGALSLRGYREQQFLASQFLFGGAEYRFILSQKTFLFGFLDAGYFTRPANPVVPTDIAESNFRIGYGFGFRFETPLGLTGFTFALGEGDSFLQGKIHFNIINEF